MLSAALIIVVSDAISTLVIWSFTELWLILILSSFPPLRAFFVHMSQQVTIAKSRPTTNGYQHSRTDKVIPMYSHKHSQGNESHESEEYIISDQAGIMKTTDIRVTHLGKKPNASVEELARYDRSPVWGWKYWRGYQHGAILCSSHWRAFGLHCLYGCDVLSNITISIPVIDFKMVI